MNDDNEIKEKQEYLRINILEKGYNADEFMDYLKSLKGDGGLEIQNWSKNDLIKAVSDFTKMKNNPEENNNVKEEILESIEENDNNPPINKINENNNKQNVNVYKSNIKNSIFH